MINISLALSLKVNVDKINNVNLYLTSRTHYIKDNFSQKHNRCHFHNSQGFENKRPITLIVTYNNSFQKCNKLLFAKPIKGIINKARST
jgi:hypothetical protein